MIDIKEKKDCCGCNACGDICPTGAIRFEKDEEGFLYPHVDITKCVHCELCVKTCPQLHSDELCGHELRKPLCFAAAHKNLATLFDSTSGGAFSALANVVYRKGGYVGGAIWDDDFSIRQYISNAKSDLPRLRSSKYAQSDARGFYKAVRAAVETGKPVLVCGCPCQMHALKAFLNKSYDNLLIADFICRGNNSPLVFRKYLDWQEEQNNGKVVYVKPKNKELGWRSLATKLVFDNGKVVYDTKETSYFTKGYLCTNAYCRPSCYECKFKGSSRSSDFTIADFWGVEKLNLPTVLDRDLGTSLVMVNTSKGDEIFAEASKDMTVQRIAFEQARAGNGMFDASLPPPKCNRDEFFRLLNRGGFAAVAKKFLSTSSGSKRRWKDWARRQINVLRRMRLSPGKWFRLFKYNSLSSILKGKHLIFAAQGVILECQGKIELGGDMIVGCGYFNEPTRKTAIAVREGGILRTHGPVAFSCGADLEVFKNAILEIDGDGGFNIGATIICGEHIHIGRHVMGGRHVTIRDNNGGHYMNLPGYRNSKPVVIGDHVWLCEGCTIMSGVKIGAGAVVGAKAVVFSKVSANTMVIGNPASVVCEDVQWKY